MKHGCGLTEDPPCGPARSLNLARELGFLRDRGSEEARAKPVGHWGSPWPGKPTGLEADPPAGAASPKTCRAALLGA